MTMRSVPAITLRKATVDDEPFLLRVYSSARADEMALVPWTEEQRKAFLRSQFVAQSSYYSKQFPDAAFELILADGEPAGRLYTAREDIIRILDLIVLPEFRNQGIGTFLICRLVAEAENTGKPFTFTSKHLILP
jgi:GNAT superfamily N-acetyltransferase